MLVIIFLMKQDQFIMTVKKKMVFMEMHQKDLKELKEEGIEAQVIPWIEDKIISISQI